MNRAEKRPRCDGRLPTGPAPFDLSAEAISRAVFALKRCGARPSLTNLARELGVHRKTLEAHRRRDPDLTDLIESALDTLAPTPAQVETLRRQGHTHARIASETGRSVSTLRRRAERDEAFGHAWRGGIRAARELAPALSPIAPSSTEPGAIGEGGAPLVRRRRSPPER
ncbi:hypothetical protein Bcep1808_2112 [Burkholderia vietnamiensis G4]|uniref:Uncharacterized protein n=1 Tax=Burkholderia vietnamiensis (strain G4 / LMG 22486) TaxID=269482 RepID=A4JFR1_BURVG|nr:hypothetical protein Bcep1808_2112 [Burkholderia vietnamiensis G4]